VSAGDASRPASSANGVRSHDERPGFPAPPRCLPAVRLHDRDAHGRPTVAAATSPGRSRPPQSLASFDRRGSSAKTPRAATAQAASPRAERSGPGLRLIARRSPPPIPGVRGCMRNASRETGIARREMAEPVRARSGRRRVCSCESTAHPDGRAGVVEMDEGRAGRRPTTRRRKRSAGHRSRGGSRHRRSRRPRDGPCPRQNATRSRTAGTTSSAPRANRPTTRHHVHYKSRSPKPPPERALHGATATVPGPGGARARSPRRPRAFAAANARAITDDGAARSPLSAPLTAMRTRRGRSRSARRSALGGRLQLRPEQHRSIGRAESSWRRRRLIRYEAWTPSGAMFADRRGRRGIAEHLGRRFEPDAAGRWELSLKDLEGVAPESRLARIRGLHHPASAIGRCAPSAPAVREASHRRRDPKRPGIMSRVRLTMVPATRPGLAARR
jgi:hypothetical protein